MTWAPERLALGLLFSILEGCAALHHADNQFKDFTAKLFHRRDPDRKAKKQEGSETASRKEPAKAKSPPKSASSGEPGPESPSEPSPTASAAAETLFEKGHEAMEQRDYDTACARFRESDRLDPAIGSKFNLANCEQQRGRYATSWQLFRQVLSLLPSGDDRIPIATDRVSTLEPLVPKLTFRVSPTLSASDAEALAVQVVAQGAGSEPTKSPSPAVSLRLASFGVPLPFDPGTHHFVVEAPGRERRVYDVELKPSEARVLTVELGSKSVGGR